MILLAQAFWGAGLSALHAFKPTIRRNTVIDWAHWIVGYSYAFRYRCSYKMPAHTSCRLLVLGWANISLGLYRASDDYETSKTIKVLWFVWLGLCVSACFDPGGAAER